MIIVKFPPNLKPIIKHASHDQSSHGSWASGLPSALLDVRASLQKYFDSGLIVTGKDNVVRYERNYYDGSTRERRVRDTLDKSTYITPMKSENPEAYAAFKEAESQMLGGSYDQIKEAAIQEAVVMGLGPRQAQYYSTAMADRASLYVSHYNSEIRRPVIEKTFGTPEYRDGEFKAYFDTRKETIGVIAENVSKSSPVVAIEEQDFLGVISDGRFKTQYEVRESNGLYRPALRREAELAFAGVPLDTPAKERPIYGYLAMQESGTSPNTSDYNSDRWNINNGGVGQYGGVRVVLKDEVKNRTSYTLVDSLDREVLPQPLNRVDKTSLAFAGAYNDLTSSHGGLQRELYAEAQIYGGVKLGDIKEVFVPDEFSAGRIREALSTKKVDIPVKVMEKNDD